jgi:hypothetical protein
MTMPTTDPSPVGLPSSLRSSGQAQSEGLTSGVAAAIDYARRHIGVCEDPVGSNRGPEIDAWAEEFGSPLGSFWCALSVGKACKVGGLWIPSHDVGSCNEWIFQATRAGLIKNDPEPGAAVVYTNGKKNAGGRYDGQLDAVHIGLVLCVQPVLLSIEGNTILGAYDRNGFVQALKEVDRSRVLSYVAPAAA